MDTYTTSVNMPTYEGGRIVKMEVDYSNSCDETIPKCKEMAKNESRFNEALELLLQLEKQARIVSKNFKTYKESLINILGFILGLRYDFQCSSSCCNCSNHL